jgi:hypothetical protein
VQKRAPAPTRFGIAAPNGAGYSRAGVGREYALAVAADATGFIRPEAAIGSAGTPFGLRSFAKRVIGRIPLPISRFANV